MKGVDKMWFNFTAKKLSRFQITGLKNVAN